MKRLVTILTNKIFLGLLGVLVLSLVIWFGADFVKFGEDNATLSTTIRLVIILGILLIWLIAQLVAMLVSHQRNQGLVKELAQPAVDPDSERAGQEVEALGKRFSDGMAILKKAKFDSANGRVSLYQLPWYIIIGPPGSGKTTALVNSGLNFPLADTHGKNALGGIGGTRNCDWWFTNEAVLIDTAGRYTTQDSHKVVDSSAWQGFLSLLKKYRPRRPLNGVLIAISAQDLLTQPAAQRSYQAKLIRERIDELQTQLGVKFPIYVMLTKADLIAGFSEFFANLTQPERQQVWGVTFDFPPSAQQLGSFNAELDILIQRLNDRVLWRVHNERDPGKRALIQAFPQQVENLKPLLDSFLAEAFSANRFSDAPMLRGVYLCSGTQEGTPIDRMMAAVSGSFGLAREAVRNQSGSGKSFFINRLFRDVVIPEAELVGGNKKLETGLIWMRRGTFAALGLLFVGLLATWSITLKRNHDYMNQVKVHTAEFETARAAIAVGSSNPADAIPALNALRSAANVYNKQEHPWLTSIGLYDSSVDEAAENLYLQATRTEFLPRFKTTIEQRLQGLNASDEALIATFRTYLMLADKEHFDADEIRRWAQSDWQQQYPQQASVQADLLAHLNLVLERGLGVVNLDQTSVATTRLKLRQIPAAQRLYSQLKSGDLGKQSLDLFAQLGARASAMYGYSDTSSILQMPALYSKAGYKTLDFSTDSPLLTQLEKDRWIFGDSEVDDFTDADKEQLAKELETLYLNDYTAQWRNLLNDMHLQKFGDLTQTTAALKVLADPVASPIVAVLRVTKDNTSLTPGWPKPPAIPGASTGANAAVDKLLDKVITPTSVDVAFRELNQVSTQNELQPAAVNDILAAVKGLHDYLNDMAVAPNPNAALFDAAKARFAGNSGDAIRKLRSLATGVPAPVKDWLNEMADYSWGVMLSGAKGHLDNAWRQQVYQSWNRTLDNRYPLRRVQSEATIDDFAAFFGPTGAEKAFVDANIRPFLTPNGQNKGVEGKSLGISSDALAQLQNADAIRAAFFADNPAMPSYQFSLTPENLDTAVGKFELQLGEQRFTYTHGPKIPKNASWQADRDTNIRVLFEDLNQNLHRDTYSGNWAWYRLLDAAGIAKTANTQYRATINKDNRKMTYRLDTRSRLSGLNLALLRNYRCPDSL